MCLQGTMLKSALAAAPRIAGCDGPLCGTNMYVLKHTRKLCQTNMYVSKHTIGEARAFQGSGLCARGASFRMHACCDTAHQVVSAVTDTNVRRQRRKPRLWRCQTLVPQFRRADRLWRLAWRPARCMGGLGLVSDRARGLLTAVLAHHGSCVRAQNQTLPRLGCQRCRRPTWPARPS